MKRDKTPAWIRTLMPDEVTRRRLLHRIGAEAKPLLAARRDSWFDAVSEWATHLSPIAAAVTLVFAGLALRHAADASEQALGTSGAPGVIELVQPGEALPAVFDADSVPDLNVVMTVLYEAEGSE